MRHLTHMCRHRWSSLRLQLMKATVLAEISFIFSTVSIHYADVYKRESGRCRALPFILKYFFINLPFQVFLLY